MADSQTAPAPFIEINRTVFPIAATTGTGTELARPDFFGTAFAVAPGVFMTAAHVLAAAVEHGNPTIAGPMPDGLPLGGARVYDYELFPDRDVALLFSSATVPTILNTWLVKPVQLLTDLSAFGYPHAVTRNNDREHFEVVFRAYKGHVITIRSFDRLPGRPSVYEVSCPFPEGLSGAPVLLNIGDDLAVAGIVIGTDTVTYSGVDHKVGIALEGNGLFTLHSQKLGGALATILNFNGATYGP
jgi:hypothetical protein